MSETHFHRLLKAKVAEVLEARRLQIADGACNDFNHYKYETGFIHGLRAALEIAGDLEREID